ASGTTSPEGGGGSDGGGDVGSTKVRTLPRPDWSPRSVLVTTEQPFGRPASGAGIALDDARVRSEPQQQSFQPCRPAGDEHDPRPSADQVLHLLGRGLLRDPPGVGRQLERPAGSTGRG